MTNCTWEEIHGFESLGEYRRFVIYIENQVSSGYAREVYPGTDFQNGFVFGGRWFEDNGSGEIWRLVPPDFPFRGLWEAVRK
jgi:hypothetical protein